MDCEQGKSRKCGKSEAHCCLLALHVRLLTARNPQLAIMTAHLYVIDSIYRFASIFRSRDSTNGKLPCGFKDAVGIESVILVPH